MCHFYFKNSKIFWGGDTAPSPEPTPLCPLNSPPLDHTSGSTTVVFLLSVLSTCGTDLFVSLHYRPSDEQYMMLICQVSRNVVSDVFILQVCLFLGSYWCFIIPYCPAPVVVHVSFVTV